MVICNILYSGTHPELLEYQNNPSINTVTDIAHLKTEAPTLVYGYKFAKEVLGEISSQEKKFNDSYYWSYTLAEYPAEAWVGVFVEECMNKFFDDNVVLNGLDVVFNPIDPVEFGKSLSPWPLINVGNFEAYFADWRDRRLVIHSVKRETLKYAGCEDFVGKVIDQLDGRFLKIDADHCQLNGGLFVDMLLYVNTDEWIGIDEIKERFNLIEIDRAKVITYYLKQSEFLRQKFDLYLNPQY